MNNSHDAKGRISSQTDVLGRITKQTYDTFGRCLRTEFPDSRDDSANTYTLFLQFTYDVSGNLASYANSIADTTRTEYNVFQQPTRIIHADGTVLLHIYYKNGTLDQNH